MAREELIELFADHEIDDDWDCRSGCDVEAGKVRNHVDAQNSHYADILISSGAIKEPQS